MNWILFVISALMVGFGQPVFSTWIAVCASLFGYALFLGTLLEQESRKKRFWLATAWFFCVQLIQLSWMISHPYFYIYGIYFLSAFIMGLQFGVIGTFIESAQFKKIRRLAAIAGLWVLLEWSRLFILSGFTWNPIGLSLSANVYSLQLASVWGIYGLSFWVLFVNLLALWAWEHQEKCTSFLVWSCAALLPFIFGFAHLKIHDHDIDSQKKLNALLVQTGFPIEEILEFPDSRSMISYVFDEWKQILKLVSPHVGNSIDVVVFPEFTVPYGTYSFVYPYTSVLMAFKEAFGKDHVKSLPKLEEPLATKYKTPGGKEEFWMVNNAYFSQAIANILQAELVIGLEDAEDLPTGEREYYSAAMHFEPNAKSGEEFSVNRYEKRVLVPMGEYIPFSFCQKLAQSYGIGGSFTPGKTAKVFGKKHVIGPSICYEETFGHLMREIKHNGAEALINLTSDVWYPDSHLPQQHFDHARLRTVENGMPLLRACNTGVTGGIDSLGRIVKVLADHNNKKDSSGALYVSMPLYNYQTLYSKFGDNIIVFLSFVLVLLGLRYRKISNNN